MAPRIFVDFRKLAVIVLLASLAYNELLTYMSAYWRWSPLPEGQGWRRVLLVADPQLLGLRDEPPWPVGTITRWDGDRYLSKTFGWALKHAAPLDAIVFLGDLTDEGSTTPYGPEYKSYVDRFRTIYPSGSARQMVYVSGDNDVGGEGSDPVTGAKVDTFRSFFPEKRLVDVDDEQTGKAVLRFVTHNIITKEVDQDDREWAIDEEQGGDEREPGEGEPNKPVIILVSHIPVLSPHMSDPTRRVVRRFSPDVIFSAHVHRGIAASMSLSPTAPSRTVNRTEYFDPTSESPIEADGVRRQDGERRPRDRRAILLLPPGQRFMAFGLASFRVGKDGGPVRMVYSNLWLPERFPALFVYVAACCVSLVFLCCSGRRGKSGAGGSRKRKSSSLPLLPMDSKKV